MATTPYDEVAYPSVIFTQTNPERLATLARVHGLDAPDVATARVLEIAGGDGMSLMAFAATYPEARGYNFDLSAAAIARGQAKVDAGKFENVTHEVLDIMAARDRYPAGSMDYVIAHGIYAWVPDVVREEVMKLMAHVLSDTGIAFVSFNAKPGAHMRMIVRDMLSYVLRDIDEPERKIAALREYLTDFAVAQENDSPLQTAVRMHAQAILSGSMSVVFHDELGPEYNPQQLSEVVEAAEAVGLTFLTDGGRNLLGTGLLPNDFPGEPSGSAADAEVVRRAQLDDFNKTRFFRQSLFVRQGRAPSRRFDPGRLRGLWVSTLLAHEDGRTFVYRNNRVELDDDALFAAVQRVVSRGLKRTPVAELSLSDQQLRAFFELYVQGFMSLWLRPDPYVAAPGDRPTTSPLIRAQLAQGEIDVHRLDEGDLRLAQPEMQRLLIAADGTRSMRELAALPDLGPLEGDVPEILAEAARRALLIA
jgi:ubiquinone/menaquinone biosynthesis C-methylase UbiE